MTLETEDNLSTCSIVYSALKMGLDNKGIDLTNISIDQDLRKTKQIGPKIKFNKYFCRKHNVSGNDRTEIQINQRIDGD